MVKPSVGIIKSFLTGESSTENGSNASEVRTKPMQKDLWTQHVCEVSSSCYIPQFPLLRLLSSSRKERGKELKVEMKIN